MEKEKIVLLRSLIRFMFEKTCNAHGGFFLLSITQDVSVCEEHVRELFTM